MKEIDTQIEVGVFEKLVGGLLLIMTFLIPLKFGTLAVMPESTGFYPDNLIAWSIISWPAHAFGLFAGIALLLALMAFKTIKRRFSTPAGLTALIWGAGLPMVSLMGWINAVTFDYAFGETAHLAGIGAYILAVYLMLDRRPQWRTYYWGCLAAGTICLALSGLYQRFWGFQETRDYLVQQMSYGAEVSPHMQLLIGTITRVYATFVSCNALAGYLLILMPITVVMADRWARQVEPVRISRIIFVVLTIGMVVPVFLMAQSRASYLALVATIALGSMTLPMRRCYRIILISLAVLVVLGGAVYIKLAGRGFSSMEERGSYLKTSIQMMTEKPLLGYGWGGFMSRHMQLKTTASDESAHDPHNLINSFSTQTGLLGLIMVLMAIVYPMFCIGRHVVGRHIAESDWPQSALFWGELAFFFHSMMELNLQIPASMAVAGAGLVSALVVDSPEESNANPTSKLFQWGGTLLVLVMAVVALWFGSYWINAEIKYDKLLSYARPSSVEEQKRPPNFTTVARLLRECASANPRSPFSWEAAGDYYMRFGDLFAAEHCYKESLKRAWNRPSVYHRLFEIGLARGERDLAKDNLRRMYELFPTNPRYKQEVEEYFPELLTPVVKNSTGN